MEFIEKALQESSFIFDGLDQLELLPLVQGFENQHVEAGTTIIKEGDEGDYFYVVYSGTVEFSVNGNAVGTATVGAAFGELALLYHCPRAATVVARDSSTLFRVDQKAFRFILRSQTEESGKMKYRLLKEVKFVKGLSHTHLSKLAANMAPRHFKKDEVLVEKEDKDCYFWILETGEVQMQEIPFGGGRQAEMTIEAGGYFGQLTIPTGKNQFERIVALSDGRAFLIDEETFKSTLGDLGKLLIRSHDGNILAATKVIADTKLEPKTVQALAGFVKEISLSAGEYIMKENETTDAAMYLVRTGKLQLTSNDGRDEMYEGVSTFGAKLLLADASTGKNGPTDSTSVAAPFTVQATENCRLGVLSLKDVRKVVDTIYIGRGVDGTRTQDSLVERKIRLEDLTKHRIIGAGTFGQVWLVSRETADGERRAYALKIQSKYELCKSGQAKAVVREKSVMMHLHHPLICRLVGAFQDATFVYMLMDLMQGGELYSTMHTPTQECLSEEDAIFYVAGIHEALSYMHRCGYVYRDLKPENVLINVNGYPVLVDFGFARHIDDRAFTLCGTPLYLPPEVILNRGYDWGADHWSLGVLTYEILTGSTPFYKEGMNQLELFRSIVKGRFEPPFMISQRGKVFLKGLLKTDPTKRLGSLAGGEMDIFGDPWFSNIDFKAIRWMTLKAPHIPNIKSSLHLSNFENWDHLVDKLSNKYEELTEAQKEIFEFF